MGRDERGVHHLLSSAAAGAVRGGREWIGARCAGRDRVHRGGVIDGDGNAQLESMTLDNKSGTPSHANPIRSIVGASSGNLVEWFDFYAYSFTSLYFAAAFFPKGDATSQLLNTAGIFALGFFMRPLGSWLFGRLADRRGRRASMVSAVMLMGFGSL